MSVPVPSDEVAILESLVKRVSHSSAQLTWRSIRNRLTALKKDRNDFTSAQDVMSIYKAVIKEGSSKRALRDLTHAVTKLNKVRDAKNASADSAPSTSTAEPPRERPAENRVDTTLQDVFQVRDRDSWC